MCKIFSPFSNSNEEKRKGEEKQCRIAIPHQLQALALGFYRPALYWPSNQITPIAAHTGPHSRGEHESPGNRRTAAIASTRP